MIDEWYSYSVFRHTKEQTLWALRNWEFFEDGVWPPEPPEYITDEYSNGKWVKVFKKKSAAVDAPISKRVVKTDAGFTRAKNISGEISLRLERTGNGGLLIAEVKAEYIVLSDEAELILGYISGKGRKKDSYIDWKRKRLYDVKRRIGQNKEV